MNRFKGLLRDTWLAWVAILAFGLIMGILVHPIFYSALPVGIFAFGYFGMMRYDKNGNMREL